MATSLLETLNVIYEGRIVHLYNNNPYFWEGSQTRVLRIPIGKNEAEIPVCLRKIFMTVYRDLRKNTGELLTDLQAELRFYGIKSYFKTPSALIRDCIGFYSTNSKTLELKKFTYEGHEYYGTAGMLFDENFNMLMMCSVKFLLCDAEPYYYKAIPILRIDPMCFSESNNRIFSIIRGKILKDIATKMCDLSHGGIDWKYCNMKGIQVIIDKVPFLINKIPAPNIQEPNESLLNVALDNIDNMVLE